MEIDPAEGKSLFAVEAYSARPDYPRPIYEFIVSRTGLKPGTKSLEIGGGNGLATDWLIRSGADPLLVIEPDRRFAPGLEKICRNSASEVEIVYQSWEDWPISAQDFALVTAATSYHWLDPETRPSKIGRCLKPGGHVALWWNVFGDSSKKDTFHEATSELLSGLAVSPSGAPDEIPFALDIRARQAEFSASGQFEAPVISQMNWLLELNSAQMVDLYSTFASISRLDDGERRGILNQLREIADTTFAGKVIRNMTSIVYVAKTTV